MMSLTFHEPLAANADVTCVRGVIKVPTMEKTREEKTSYCYDLGREILISEGCQQKTKCDIEKAFDSKASALSKRFSKRGTPGSSLCKQLGGSSQVIEFKVDKTWEKLNRCYMETDGSFVDLATLVRWSGP